MRKGLKQEIMDPKQSEEQLSRLASFPDQNPDPLIETDFEGKVTYLNAVSKARFPELTAEGLQHPMLQDLSSIARTLINDGDQPFVREIELEDSIYEQKIIRVPNKDLLRIYSHDITQRRRSQEALQENEQLFREIAEGIRDVLFVVDHKDYKILYVNPAYEEVFGRSLKTVYERPTSWIDAVAPEDRDRIKAALENQQRTGMFDENFRIIRPNHSVRWIHDRVFPIRDVHGEIFRVVGIAEDITEQMQALQSTAADEERRRLARQLHDSVTQSLYSLTLMTNGWAAMSENGKLENPAESFRQLENLGVQALGEMRLLIHQLRPPTLEEAGLAGALQERLDAVERRQGLEAQLFIEGDLDRLPRQVEEELFHITQEALNNTLRHAEASNILVRLVVENGSARLTIEDDGRGFDLTHTNGGLGLTTMRERAESMGGRFQLASGNGKGTLVDVLINLVQD